MAKIPASLTDLRRGGLSRHGRSDPGLRLATLEGRSTARLDRALLWQPDGKLTGVKYLLTFEPLGQVARGGAQGLSGRQAAPVAVSRQPAVLGQPGLSQTGRGVALGRADSAVAFDRAARKPDRHSRAAVGLAARTQGRRRRRSKDVRGPVRNTFLRTNRWGRVHRYEDELKVTGQEDRVAHVLFSTAADDVGLYGKPMARNAQVWTRDFELLLDGPRATSRELAAAAEKVAAGGLFGYRFYYPPMRVWRARSFLASAAGRLSLGREVTVVVCRRAAGLFDGATGPIEPQLTTPGRTLAAAARSRGLSTGRHRFSARPRSARITARRSTSASCWMPSVCWAQGPCRAIWRRSLLTLPKHETLDDWLESLPDRAVSAEVGQRVQQLLAECIAPAKAEPAKAKSGKGPSGKGTSVKAATAKASPAARR